MKRGIYFLIILLIQSGSSLLHAQDDSDTLIFKLNQYKGHLISGDNLKPGWVKTKVGFNLTVDSIYFEDSAYDSLAFIKVFNKYLKNNVTNDTLAIGFDFRDNIHMEGMYKSFSLLSSEIKKSHFKCYYYYFTSTKSKKTIVTDTLVMKKDRIIELNTEVVPIGQLEEHLRTTKTTNLVLKVDKELLIQDLAEIMNIAKNLNIIIVLDH